MQSLTLRSMAALVLAALTLGALMPRDALAHATLVKCNIARGAVLTAAPKTLICTLAEGVNPKGSILAVVEAVGDQGVVDQENSSVSFSNVHQMTVGVPKLPKGAYDVLWYTVSADDGHRAGGVMPFSIK